MALNTVNGGFGIALGLIPLGGNSETAAKPSMTIARACHIGEFDFPIARPAYGLHTQKSMACRVREWRWTPPESEAQGWLKPLGLAQADRRRRGLGNRAPRGRRARGARGVALDGTRWGRSATARSNAGVVPAARGRTSSPEDARTVWPLLLQELRAHLQRLTKTPIARLREKERWLYRAQAMLEETSLAEAAERCGVHPTTAFRLATPVSGIARLGQAQSARRNRRGGRDIHP
jgi:hypothetical protein